MKRTRVIFMAVSMTVVLLFTSMLLANRSGSDDDLFQALGNLAEVVHLVQSEYVDELNQEALALSLDAGIVESIDPWGAVLAPEDVQAYTDLMNRPPAFGLCLGSRLGSAAVRHVLAGSPAEKAGIEQWEVIEVIDGVNTRGQPLWQIRIKLDEMERLEKAVTLDIFDSRVDERREVVLEPEPWTPEPLSSQSVDGVQIVTIESLPSGSAAETASVVKAGGPLILDLRDLAWGLEEESLQVADVFVDTGVLGMWRGRKAGEKVFNANRNETAIPVPIVLVGPNTEGVGETLAAALKRSGSTVVGNPTIGHAPHMQMIAAGDVFLWVPVGQWLLDDETPITTNGIEPDEQVDDVQVEFEADDEEDADEAEPSDEVETPESDAEEDDPILDRALELARSSLDQAA